MMRYISLEADVEKVTKEAEAKYRPKGTTSSKLGYYPGSKGDGKSFTYKIFYDKNGKILSFLLYSQKGLNGTIFKVIAGNEHKARLNLFNYIDGFIGSPQNIGIVKTTVQMATEDIKKYFNQFKDYSKKISDMVSLFNQNEQFAKNIKAQAEKTGQADVIMNVDTIMLTQASVKDKLMQGANKVKSMKNTFKTVFGLGDLGVIGVDDIVIGLSILAAVIALNVYLVNTRKALNNEATKLRLVEAGKLPQDVIKRDEEPSILKKWAGIRPEYFLYAVGGFLIYKYVSEQQRSAA